MSQIRDRIETEFLSLIINLLGKKKKEYESKIFKTSLSINLSSFPNICFILENVIFAYLCDAPKPGGPLTTRQPAENLYISYHETHT